MSIFTKYFVNNTKNNSINWASEESLTILRQLASNFRSLNNVDPYGRLKVIIDSCYSNNPASVSNYSGSSSAQSQTVSLFPNSVITSMNAGSAPSFITYFDNGGNYDTRYLPPDIMNQAFCSGIRKNLTFS